MRPVAHALDQAVLERIDVAIFDMARVIGVIADEMLPKPPLPDAALAARPANGTELIPFWQRSGKTALDQPPARRDIAIPRVQTACRWSDNTTNASVVKG